MEAYAYIYRCLSPERTWHKVIDLKVDYSGVLGEGKVEHKPMLKPCWTMMQLAHRKGAQPKPDDLRPYVYLCWTVPVLTGESLLYSLEKAAGNMEAYATSFLLQTIQQEFGLGECICQKRYVISVVSVRNCLCRVSPASCSCLSEAIFFRLIYQRSKYVI